MFQSPNPQWPLVTFDRTYMAQLVTTESCRAHNSTVIKVAVVHRNAATTLGFSFLSSSLKADKTQWQRCFTGSEKKKNRKTEKWVKENSADLTRKERVAVNWDENPFHLLTRENCWINSTPWINL